MAAAKLYWSYEQVSRRGGEGMPGVTYLHACHAQPQPKQQAPDGQTLLAALLLPIPLLTTPSNCLLQHATDRYSRSYGMLSWSKISSKISSQL
jgi:hypothetical protein